jgi:hypothetical protein
VVWRNIEWNPRFTSGLASLEFNLTRLMVFLYSRSSLHTPHSVCTHYVCTTIFKIHNQVRKHVQQAFSLHPSHHSFFHNSSVPIFLPKPSPVKQTGYKHLQHSIFVLSSRLQLLPYLRNTLNPLGPLTPLKNFLRIFSYPLLRRQILAIRTMLTPLCECVFDGDAEDYKWKREDVD